MTHLPAMEPSVSSLIRREAADALLDRGVRIPLWTVRVPFRRRPLRFCVVMRRPRLGGLIRLASLYESLGVSAERVEHFTPDEARAFIVRHGRTVSRMVACTLCRGIVARWLLEPVAWLVRHRADPACLDAALLQFTRLTGTELFTPIIRSAHRMNPMKLRLSQHGKGS